MALSAFNVYITNVDFPDCFFTTSEFQLHDSFKSSLVKHSKASLNKRRLYKTQGALSPGR